MASDSQSKYIADLAVIKTKEFKEVKELLIANAIVGVDAEVVKSAQTIAEVTHALTDLQASKFIDVLNATKEPTRATSYSKKRIEKVTAILESIKKEIDGWDFPAADVSADYGKLARSLKPKVMSAIALLNNPEIAPDTRQLNQEIFLRQVATAIYEKTYEMNAFDMEIPHTKGAGIDDRYYGMAKVASNSVSTGAA